MTRLTDKHWAIEVPDNATGIEICNYGLNDALEWVHHIAGIAIFLQQWNVGKEVEG